MSDAFQPSESSAVSGLSEPLAPSEGAGASGPAEPLAPSEREWIALDPNYLKLKRLMVLVTWPLLTLAAAAGAWFGYRWWAGVAVAVAGALLTARRWWIQQRRVAAWGYALNASDLWIRNGLWFKETTIVPYGRMQVVTVNSGPIEQRFGLATVELQTASSGTDATIPGLSTAQAESLRDHLSELGEQQAVGL